MLIFKRLLSWGVLVIGSASSSSQNYQNTLRLTGVSDCRLPGELAALSSRKAVGFVNKVVRTIGANETRLVLVLGPVCFCVFKSFCLMFVVFMVLVFVGF